MAPIGPPALHFEVELVTRPEGNLRSWRGRATRAGAARETITDEIAATLAQGHELPTVGPWCVRMTRITPHALLDVGNLWAALKATEDAVAAALGVDDGDSAFAAAVAQERRKGALAVRVEVWGPQSLPKI